ncbi:asparagine synthase-related protein [Streptomyces sp. M10(2022)]
MENSVEGRYPFLGNPVVDLALLVGDDEKVSHFAGKQLLESAYAG